MIQARPRTLPHGHVRTPSEGQLPQGPTWQTRSQRCLPQLSRLPQARAQWNSGTAHGTEAVSVPHWHVRLADSLHGGQSPVAERSCCVYLAQ